MHIVCFLKKTATVFFLVAFAGIHAAGMAPRNLLQKQEDEQVVKSFLLPKEKWIPYPSYNDRNGWDRFLGNYKADIIKAGEVFLTYQWQVVTATDYLEFSRSGSRTIMEEPYNKNLNAISALFLAEMAENAKVEVISNLITKLGFTDEQAADVAGVSIDFIKRFKE